MLALKFTIFVCFVPHFSFTERTTDTDPVDSEVDGYAAAAKFIKLGLDLDADPCDNFPQFNCGNLAKNLKLDPNQESYSSFSETSTNFTRRVVKLLDELKPSDTPIPHIANKLKLFWDKCLTRSEPSSVVASAKDAIEMSKEFGGAPLFNPNWEVPEKSFFFYTLEVYKRVKSTFGVYTRVKEDREAKQNVLYAYLNTGVNRAGFQLNVHSLFAKLTGKSMISEDQISTQEAEMSEAKEELEKVLNKLESSYTRKLISLKELYELLPDVGESLSNQGIGNATHIYIEQRNIDEIKAMKPLVSKYSKYRRAFQNFLMSSYFNKVQRTLDVTRNFNFSALPHVANSTTQHSDDMDEETLDTTHIKDLPGNVQTCLKLVARYSQYTVLRLFVEKYGPTREEALKLRRLIELVREELRNKFMNASWLDYSSKIRGLNKLTSIIPRVAYPMWVVNDTAFQAYHRGLGTLSNSDSYFKILSAAIRNLWINNMDLANRPIAQDYNSFGKSSFSTNAWYTFRRNAFSLALGILQPPFYRPDYPPALIYGIIGAITGHEIIHGYDKRGVHRSMEGEWEPWMTNNSFLAFANRSLCIEQQYSNFCYNISGKMHCVDGHTTASENIADIDGLKAAYKAYKRFMKESGAGEQDRKLPGVPTSGDFNFPPIQENFHKTTTSPAASSSSSINPPEEPRLRKSSLKTKSSSFG